MSEVSERYQHLTDAFATKVAAVPADKWEAQSPCPDWNARDVVRHVVDTQGLFLGFVGKSLGDIPSVDDDPLGAFDAARAIVQKELDDPATATTEYDGFLGRTTLEASINRFLCVDLVLHGWDLARATGLDETIEPADVAWAQEVADGYGEMARSPQVFGPAVEVPADADAQTKLLAFTGRTP